MPSLSSLLSFCKSQARIEAIDFFDPRFPRAEEVKAWQAEKRRRDRARKACFLAFPGRLSSATESVVPGRYGRLVIGADGSLDYIVGQYAPAEIYGALLSYLKATN